MRLDKLNPKITKFSSFDYLPRVMAEKVTKFQWKTLVEFCWNFVTFSAVTRRFSDQKPHFRFFELSSAW